MNWLGLPLAVSCGIADAATFTVSNLNDGGPGSLRQAVLEANISAGGNVIAFAYGLGGTILLTGGEIAVTGNITVDGNGADTLAISGNNTSRIFSVAEGATFAVNRIQLKDGRDSQAGGAIYNRGAVVVSYCAIRGNSAGSTSGGFGGGGIANDGGTLTVRSTTVGENSAWPFGGGILNVNGGTLTVVDSTLASNSTLVFDVATTGGGGGISNFARGTAAVINSTVVANTAKYGGAVSSDGTATLSIFNSTLAGNSALVIGGGISRGTLGYNPPHVANTLIANNAAPAGDQCSDPVLDDGHNLDSGSGCGLDTAKGSLINRDPQLGPLTDNGGPTPTMLPTPGSPAIDAGDNALVPPGLVTDQRGYPRIQEGTVDIGATESEPAGPTVPIDIKGIPALGHLALLVLGSLVATFGCQHVASRRRRHREHARSCAPNEPAPRAAKAGIVKVSSEVRRTASS